MRIALPVSLFFWLLACTSPPAAVPTTDVSPPPAITTPEEKETPQPEPKRLVVLTIDDLPLADFKRYSKKERTDLVVKMTRGLKEAKVPFVGFFNMSLDAKDPSLLPHWRGLPGMTPGNHTWSHPNPRKVGTDRYIEDLERGHHATLALPNAPSPLPFRYPFLHEGFPCEQRAAIKSKLQDLKSEQLPVTIDTWDWYYSRKYEAAQKAGDTERARVLVDSYFANIHAGITEAELLSQKLFDRLPPQVVLLHGNPLLADHLPRLLTLLRGRGYEVVPWSLVRRDPAFQEPDRSVSPSGTNRWLRLLRSRAAPNICSP